MTLFNTSIMEQNQMIHSYHYREGSRVFRVASIEAAERRFDEIALTVR